MLHPRLDEEVRPFFGTSKGFLLGFLRMLIFVKNLRNNITNSLMADFTLPIRTRNLHNRW